MSTLPGVIGGRLAGRVLTSVDLDASAGYRITLNNIHRVTTGSGDSRSTSERLLWQDERHLLEETAQYDPSRSEIPIDFQIPYDASPTEERSDDDKVLWRLEVEAEVPGVDYSSQFEVPVFKTAESRPKAEEDDSHTEAWGGSTDVVLDLHALGIDSELLPTGGRRLTLAAARHKGASSGTSSACCWFTAPSICGSSAAPSRSIPSIWSSRVASSDSASPESFSARRFGK
jgi:HSP20 family molecular chaperone IbpA